MSVSESSAAAAYFLAIDTSTEVLSLALGVAATPASSAHDAAPQLWQYTGAGGSHSSATLIPEALRLLAQAGLRLQDVQALVVGVGPGSFTGLRTACAVAQGLALGAGTPVLPVSTLLAVAEDWRARQAPQPTQGRVWALLDARMDEIYAACWQWQSDAAPAGRAAAAVQWQCVQTPVLVAPEDLLALPGWQAGDAWAGNVQAVYGPRLLPPVNTAVETAMPTAAALLRLAPALWQQGAAVDAALLLPHYVRDKVAQTTAEREAERAARQTTARAATAQVPQAPLAQG